MRKHRTLNPERGRKRLIEDEGEEEDEDERGRPIPIPPLDP